MKTEQEYKHLTRYGVFSVSAPEDQARELDEAIEFLHGWGMSKAAIGRDAIILYAQDCGFEYEEQGNENDS